MTTTASLSPVVKYHGLARRLLMPAGLLMRPLLNGGTLGGRERLRRHVPEIDSTVPLFTSHAAVARLRRDRQGLVQDLTFLRGNGLDESSVTDISDLAHALAASEFVSAGLCALTSHSDLLLGQSTRVLDNPYLHIVYDFDLRRFVLTYFDGSAVPWSRVAEPRDAFDVVTKFLTKRARWFTDKRP